ncbi:unnamed protein product [Bathycoccus prasinos]
MNDAPPMSDAPPMTQEDAVEDRYIKDRFMNGGIFKAKKSAIKEQKSNLRQTRNPGQYQVSEAAKACIERFVTHNAANASGKSNVDDEERKRLVSQVAWADDENGSDADLKTLLEPTVVISPTLYDGFVADRNKSSGGATLNATKNTCDLRSAALGAFADYLFEEEEELKQKYDEKDRIKTFLVNKDAWKHKDRRGVFATSSREWREYSRALMASRIAPKR